MKLSIEQQNELALAIKAFPRCSQAKINQAAIRNWLRDWYVDSLAAVARVFGYSYTTVKSTWRPSGMPGDADANKWPLADIFIWLLEREAKSGPVITGEEFTRQLNELELRKADAVTRIQERKADVAEGEYVQLASVQRVLRGMLNVVRDGFLTIPRKWTPRFPAKYSREWTTELENDIRGVLTIIAEKPVEDFLERTESDV